MPTETIGVYGGARVWNMLAVDPEKFRLERIVHLLDVRQNYSACILILPEGSGDRQLLPYASLPGRVVIISDETAWADALRQLNHEPSPLSAMIAN